jgi:hypothetical protein
MSFICSFPFIVLYLFTTHLTDYSVKSSLVPVAVTVDEVVNIIVIVATGDVVINHRLLGVAVTAIAISLPVRNPRLLVVVPRAVDARSRARPPAICGVWNQLVANAVSNGIVNPSTRIATRSPVVDGLLDVTAMVSLVLPPASPDTARTPPRDELVRDMHLSFLL